jgi:chemotaxis protein methyltransferase CheR
MSKAGILDAAAFVDHINTDERTLDALVEDLTITETYFFREPAQFDMLRREILPSLCANLSNPDLRVWSAGCASGEEAYSLAILLEQHGLAERAAVLGTDISRFTLKAAKLGAYGVWSFRGCSEEFQARYFHRRADRFVIRDDLKRKVEFRYLNLVSDTYPSGIDLILCRNVLIYFERDIIERIARQLFAALREGGWLIAGPSDPPLWEFAPFETVVTPEGVFYRRGNAASLKTVTAPQMSVSQAPRPALDVVSIIPSAPDPKPAPVTVDVLTKAHAAFEAGDFRQVVELTRTTIDDPRLAALRIRAFANLNDRKTAMAFADKAAQQHPLSAELHYLQAIILMDLDRIADATKVLRRVIYLDRSLAVAHFTLACLYSRSGDAEPARVHYRNVLKLCSARPGDEIAPLSEGERTDRLAEAARRQLERVERGLEATR